MARYSQHYYQTYIDSAWRSAQAVVPLVLDLIQPGSVIDIGCGIGAWLAVFHQHGVEDMVGVDGDHVVVERLVCPSECFITSDLRRPFHLERCFDLAVSLEVAEHLPAACARDFVTSLTRLSPVVLFSAAVPGQGGTGHVNEQWPEYWDHLFQQQGYRVIDCLRTAIWHNDRVAWWYAQNILLFARGDYLQAHPRLQHVAAQTDGTHLARIHPRRAAFAPQIVTTVRENARALWSIFETPRTPDDPRTRQ